MPRGLSLEFDALYQRINYDHAGGTATAGTYSSQSFEQATANRWQFPLLVQYSLNVAKLKPFVEAGPSIAAIAGGRSTVATSTVAAPSPASTNTYTRTFPTLTTAGVTAGGGVAIPFMGHSLHAEVRFSHWFRGAINSPSVLERSGDFSGVLIPDPINPNLLRPLTNGFSTTQPNEASFLLGLSF